jgi:glycerol uptake facilitator-like aquaporin
MASQEETRKKLIKIGRCFAAELVGTAILTFCATEKAVLNNTSIGGDAISEEDAVTTNALAAGFSLIFLIYSLANVSGGHVNPAVTWAFVLTGRLPPLMGVVYFIAQFLGGLIGAGLLAAFSGVENFRGLLALHPGISVQEGLGTETFLTFLFVFVIFK